MTKKPSYRFVGFEDEWKEVKLGEILVERNEQISENEEYQLRCSKSRRKPTSNSSSQPKDKSNQPFASQDLKMTGRK